MMTSDEAQLMLAGDIWKAIRKFMATEIQIGPGEAEARGYSDALLAFSGGKFVVLRVPYPMGFYHRGVEGRIDDPKAGWKGRGLWANYGSYNPWHYEGGKGQRSKAVHFQLRPDPLAK